MSSGKSKDCVEQGEKFMRRKHIKVNGNVRGLLKRAAALIIHNETFSIYVSYI